MMQRSDFIFKNEFENFASRNSLLNDRVMNDAIEHDMKRQMRHELYEINFEFKNYFYRNLKKIEKTIKILKNDTYYYKIRENIKLHENEKTTTKLKRVIDTTSSTKNFINSIYMKHSCIVQNSNTKKRLNQNQNEFIKIAKFIRRRKNRRIEFKNVKSKKFFESRHESSSIFTWIQKTSFFFSKKKSFEFKKSSQNPRQNDSKNKQPKKISIIEKKSAEQKRKNSFFRKSFSF